MTNIVLIVLIEHCPIDVLFVIDFDFMKHRAFYRSIDL